LVLALVAASGNGLARAEAKATLKGHADTVNAVAFAPDGMTLASAAMTTPSSSGRRDREGIADVARTRRLRARSGVLPGRQGTGLRQRGRHGPDLGRATGRLTATMKGHTDSVNGIAFSRDGKLLASAGDDQTFSCGTSPRRGKR